MEQVELALAPPGAALLAADTLLLMPCSATKREGACWSAFVLYDGPLWQTLRRRKPHAMPWGNVLVLSGQYGLINARTTIVNYEGRLTPRKAEHLMRRGVMERNDWFGAIKPGRVMGCHPYFEAANGRMYHDGHGAYRHVINAGAGEYRRVFVWLIAELQEAGLIAPDATTREVSGGIGEQRSQLGRWLAELREGP